MGSKNNSKTLFWRRSFSSLIDIVIIYCISFLVQQLVNRAVFVTGYTVFAICWLLYYTVCYRLLNGRTFARVITGLQVTGRSNTGLSVREILIREVVCKFFIILALPVIIGNHLHFYRFSQLLIPACLIIVVVLIMLGLFVLFKKPWWELVSSTKTVRNPVSRKSIYFAAFSLSLGLSVITVFVKISPFFKKGADFQTKFYPEYPSNPEVKAYAEFIKTRAQDPADYIFGLFDKYDLVVLNERTPHSEYTQYELIKRIIGDKRFADNIGNLYTEIGSVSLQDTLQSYLNTSFPDKDSLNKATAFLQRSCNPIWPLWGCTNLFDLLKFVNKINSHSDDSAKINWYFTDIPVDWETMTAAKWKNAPKEQRDKIMAGNIIDIYRKKITKNERRIKGLVIMNARHGYGLIRDVRGNKKGHYYSKINTTEILMESLPDKVCNVLINTVPFGLGIFWGQVQNGKWDKAFALAGNTDAGFDFENSPFGSDNFDGAIGFPSRELRYQDVFTGFVFYKPLERFVNKTGFPYMLYNFNDTLIRRANCISKSYADDGKGIIRYYEKDQIISSQVPFALFYNLIFNIGFSIIIILSMIICGVFFKPKSVRIN